MITKRKNKYPYKLTNRTNFYLCGSVAIDTYEVLYLKRELNIYETEYSFIVSFSGIAFILAGILNTYISKKIPSKILFLIGISISSFSYLLFSLAWNTFIICLSLFILAFGYTTFSTAFLTICQSTISIDKQGRIFSFLNLLPQAAIMITILMVNVFLNIFPIRLIFILLSLITIFGFISSLPMLKNNKENGTMEKTSEAIKQR
ncbi:MFS transporter [Scopulibacillus daqui]|uniref:MFS transporter n=1 Tax=Scopulibacillus daqui TaxID=1469162 RepID=UPI0019606CC2